MEQAERRDRAMRHSPINEGEPSLDDVCRCDSDLPDDEPFDEALEGDFEDDPCPHSEAASWDLNRQCGWKRKRMIVKPIGGDSQRSHR